MKYQVRIAFSLIHSAHMTLVVSVAMNRVVLDMQLFLSTDFHIFMAIEQTTPKGSKDGRCPTTLAYPGADTGQQRKRLRHIDAAQ